MNILYFMTFATWNISTLKSTTELCTCLCPIAENPGLFNLLYHSISFPTTPWLSAPILLSRVGFIGWSREEQRGGRDHWEEQLNSYGPLIEVGGADGRRWGCIVQSWSTLFVNALLLWWMWKLNNNCRTHCVQHNNFKLEEYGGLWNRNHKPLENHWAFI